MGRLILHIGTHKTATTTIQNFLHHHRDTLAERGVFYPDYSLVRKKSHYAHLGMVNALSGRHRNYGPELAERFFAKVRERIADYDTTIISAEPFYRHVDNAPGDDPYYAPKDYWPLRNAYIERIREIFGDAEVVVVFRRQADYAQSLYQEHVKVTRYRGNFSLFLKDFWFHFVFGQQVAAWNRVFPTTRAMSFDKLIASGDVVGEFCRLLNLPVSGLDALPRANEGMATDLVVLKRMLHRTSTDKDTLRAQMEALSDKLPAAVHDLSKSRSFFASGAAMKAFQAEFADENEKLRPFMMHDLAPDAPIFNTGFRKGLLFGDRLNSDFLHAVMMLALGQSAGTAPAETTADYSVK